MCMISSVPFSSYWLHPNVAWINWSFSHLFVEADDMLTDLHALLWSSSHFTFPDNLCQMPTSVTGVVQDVSIFYLGAVQSARRLSSVMCGFGRFFCWVDGSLYGSHSVCHEMFCLVVFWLDSLRAEGRLRARTLLFFYFFRCFRSRILSTGI